MKWEYKTEIFHEIKQEFNERLNELGEEGWELINLIPQVGSTSDFAVGDVDINFSCCEAVYVEKNIAIFKRQKQ